MAGFLACSSGETFPALSSTALSNNHHSDKPDEELKRENMERKGELPPHGAETAAGVGAAGAGVAGISDYEQHERAGEHQGMSEADKLMQAREHDRNRLHKDPPPGYIEQKMEHSHGGSGMGSS